MEDVGFDDLKAVWTGVSLSDVRRVTGLARRVLSVPTAMLCSSPDGTGALCFPLGDHRFLPHDLRGAQLLSADDTPHGDATQRNGSGDPTSALPVLASLDAPLTFDGQRIGTLSVFDGSPRTWTEDDRTTLADLAECLANLVVLRHRAGNAVAVAANGASHVDLSHVDLSHVDYGAPSLVQDDDGTAGLVDDAAPESAHILLADDLDLNRKLICDMLSLEGHIVDSVPDGAAAVKAAGETRYDLILMDMIMPGMDGVAATRAIRALPAPACEVPIVALTAHSLPEQLESCLQAGMDATLVKPMTMDALTSAVAMWTRTRRKAA